MWKFKTTESNLWANSLFFPADLMEKKLKLQLSLQRAGYRNLNHQLMMTVVCAIVNLNMTSPIAVLINYTEQNCISPAITTTADASL